MDAARNARERFCDRSVLRGRGPRAKFRPGACSILADRSTSYRFGRSREPVHPFLDLPLFPVIVILLISMDAGPYGRTSSLLLAGAVLLRDRMWMFCCLRRMILKSDIIHLISSRLLQNHFR